MGYTKHLYNVCIHRKYECNMTHKFAKQLYSVLRTGNLFVKFLAMKSSTSYPANYSLTRAGR